MYYLAEWRNNSGFDRGLKYPYTTVYSNEDTNEWQVDRAPYTVPGMLLWLRNGAYDFDYTLYDSLYDPPSYGPKHALLVVDSHYWPLEWDGMGTHRRSPAAATRAPAGQRHVHPAADHAVHRPQARQHGDRATSWRPRPSRRSRECRSSTTRSGYYPGLRYTPMRTRTEGLYFWDAAASAVVPAKAPYTTRITWDDKSPATDLYGADLGDTVLGSGDPRDDGVQYGINLAILQKAHERQLGQDRVLERGVAGRPEHEGQPREGQARTADPVRPQGQEPRTGPAAVHGHGRHPGAHDLRGRRFLRRRQRQRPVDGHRESGPGQGPPPDRSRWPRALPTARSSRTPRPCRTTPPAGARPRRPWSSEAEPRPTDGNVGVNTAGGGAHRAPPPAPL